MTEKQPMAGGRRKVCPDPFETVAFAKRRQKTRRRNELAKASRRKNR